MAARRRHAAAKNKGKAAGTNDGSEQREDVGMAGAYVDSGVTA
jgi:hypothetical protein